MNARYEDPEALQRAAAFADDAARDDGAGLDLRELVVRGVLRSLPWVCALVLLGAAAGILVGAIQPDRYVSETKLLLRVGAREQVTAESLVDFEERPRAAALTLADELHMLRDEAIFERVARALGPARLLAPADPSLDGRQETSFPRRVRLALFSAWSRWSAGSAECATCAIGSGECEDCLRAATKLLVENTVVAPSEPGSSVILLTHTSSTPERAREVTGALAAAFIERHREEFSIRSLLEKNRGKLEQARAARDTAANAYVEHLNENGVLHLDTQIPRLEVALAALENELFDARVRREEIARLKKTLAARLQGIPAEIELPTSSVMVPNEEYETQLALKRTLLLQKQTLLVENRPSEEMRRRERELDNQITKVEERLRGTPKVVPQGSDTMENLGHTSMEARIADLDVEDGALAVKVELLESRLDEKQAQMAKLQRELLVQTTIQKDLAAARDAEQNRYAQLLARFSALEALEAIDLEEEANLRVLQAATLPEEKVGPKRFGLLLKGLLAGTLAGLALAVLRQRFDPKLHDPRAFERAGGAPVLAVVPYRGGLGRASQRTLARTSGA